MLGGLGAEAGLDMPNTQYNYPQATNQLGNRSCLDLKLVEMSTWAGR